jgi:hypothetical protein
MDDKDILLVDFDMLLNYDYAILYMNHNINNLSDIKPCKEVYELLQNRTRYNVLSIDYPNETDEQLENRKKDLIVKYNDIITSNLIANDNIFNVVNAAQHQSMIELTICCKTQTEEQIIKELFGYNTILDNEVEKEQFDTFFVHTPFRLYSNPRRYIGNAVYMAMVRYNLNIIGDKVLLPEELALFVADKINLKLINLFT